VSHGGHCQSKDYIDCHEPLKFTCAQGHDFEAALASVNAADHPRPRFCPECGRTRRRTFEENAALVAPSGYEWQEEGETRGGADERRLVVFHLRCPAGHEFRSLRSNFLPVVDGLPHRGCIRCARKRTNQARGQAARCSRLAEFGLEALDEYASRHKVVRWRCLAAGHEFAASWNSINARRGRKCLECPR
jgi:hypothetical protein